MYAKDNKKRTMQSIKKYKLNLFETSTLFRFNTTWKRFKQSVFDNIFYQFCIQRCSCCQGVGFRKYTC